MIPGVTIVVPVWNRADLLRNLLATISSQTLAPEQVIVVDNGSTDDAANVARGWGASVIDLGRNRGFAAAVNRGIEESHTEWIALVNSDVELYPDWLERIVAAAFAQDGWFAGGKILLKSDPARIDGTFDLIARSGCAWRAGNGFPDSPEFSQAQTASLIPATAALYRRELFVRVGNFGEVYESYLEDVDLSLRASVAGLRGIYVPSAICLHHGSASSRSVWSDRIIHLLARNQEILIRRLYSRELRHEWRFRILTGRLLWGLLALRHGRFAAWLRGKRDARTMEVSVLALDPDSLKAIIAESEGQILRIQRKLSWNRYWRLYFFFTGGESE